jgi:Zn-dependent peptidase ImmA (M78 family)
VADGHVESAREAALSARRELGLDLVEPVHDLLELIEGAPVGIPVAVVQLAPGVAGMYVKKRGRSFIFINGTQRPVARQRLTLAHELGHHWLGHDAVVDGVDVIEGSATLNRVERQAFEFAGELLAPAQALRGWMDNNQDPVITPSVLVRIGAHFGISAPAARVRLIQAGVLANRARQNELKKLLDQGVHRQLEGSLDLEPFDDELARIFRNQSLPRVPAVLRDDALAAYAAGLISPDRLAAALRITPAAAAQLTSEMGLEPVSPDPEW